MKKFLLAASICACFVITRSLTVFARLPYLIAADGGAGGRPPAIPVNRTATLTDTSLQVIPFTTKTDSIATDTVCYHMPAVLHASIPPEVDTTAAGYTYTWETSPDGFDTWSLIAGQTGPVLHTDSLTDTRYYRVSATPDSIARDSAFQVFKVVVWPALTISPGTVPPICQGAPGFEIPYTNVTGNPDSYHIFSNDLPGFIPLTDTVLPPSPIVVSIPDNTAPGSYNGSLELKHTATGCNAETYALQLVVNAPAAAGAGPDQIQYNSGVFTMAADTPVTGAGQWQVVNGTAIIADTADPHTTVTIPADSATTLRWIITPETPCPPDSDEVVIRYLQQADLSISKTDSVTAYTPGGTVAYTIRVQNDGPSNVNGVMVKDPLPDGITTASWTAIPDSGAQVPAVSDTGALHQTVNMAAGSGITYTLILNIPPAFTGHLVNTAMVEPPAGFTDHNPGNNTAADTDTSSPQYGLVVTKSGPANISAGQQVTYTIQVTNNGPSDASDINITDLMPAQLQQVTWTAKPKGNAAVNVWAGTGNIDLTASIPAGDSNAIIITVTGIVDPAYSGTMINTATATPPGKGAVTASVSTRVTSDPGIQITKTGPDSLSAGQAVGYVIRVANTGPSDAAQVAITDTIPAGIRQVSWTALADGTGTHVSAGAGTGNVNITADLPVGTGHMITVVINGIVDPGYKGTTLSNWSAASPPGKPPVYSDTIHTCVIIDPGVQIVKSGPQEVHAGATVTYQLVVSNQGPSDASAVRITDSLPAGLQHVSWTAVATGTGTAIDTSNGVGPVNIMAVIPADTSHFVTVTIRGTVDPAFTDTTLHNTASAALPGKPPVSSTVTTAVSRINDLQIVKSGPQLAIAGEKLSYTIRVFNAGPGAAIGALIQDSLPAELQDVTWTATTSDDSTTVSTASGSGNNISITANLPAGSDHTITIEITGRLHPGATITQLRHTATVTPPPGATDPTPAISTVTTEVRRECDLVIVNNGPADKAAGQTIAYRLVITNNGPSDVTGAKIRNVLPATVSEISFATTATGTAQVTGNSLDSNTISFTGNIPAGSDNSIVLDITGQVSPTAAAGTITNTATVTAPPGITETFPATNTSSITTNINTNIGLQISKSGPALANAGGPITYTIEVTNTGTANAVGVILLDNVPAGISNVTWTAQAVGNNGTSVSKSGGTGNGINMTANIESTANGPGKIVVTINGTIATTMDSTIINTATLEYAGTKQSSFTTAINHSADLRISKAGPASIDAGRQISYNIDVINAGPADASGVLIIDTIPHQIKQVNWTVTPTGTATASVLNGTGNIFRINAGMPVATDNSIRITVTGTVDPAFTGPLINSATAIPPPGTPDPTPAGSTVITAVNLRYGLHILKGGPASVAAGQQVTYTVTVLNDGPSNADSVVIIDNVPPQMQQVTWTAVAAGAGTSITSAASGTGNKIRLTASMMGGVGHRVDVTITGIVDAASGGAFSNTATATAPDGTTISSTVNTVVNNSPGLEIVKSGPSNINAGQHIVYTIAVTNQGPSNAPALMIRDQIPPQVQQVTWTATAAGPGAHITGNSSGNGNNITVNGGIAAGADNKINITINGIVDPAYAGTISNKASIICNDSSTVNSTPVATTVTRKTGLLINKSAPAAARANDSIMYTIRVTNTGPSNATDALISDLVAAGISNVSWTATPAGKATISSGATGLGAQVAVKANIPAGPNNMITLNIGGRIIPGFSGLLKNIASVTLPGGPPVTTDTNTTTVERSADIRIVKSGPATATTGGSITYTIDVSNAGPGDADTVTITDNVPPGIIVQQWNVTAVNGYSTVYGPAAGTGNNIRVQTGLHHGALFRITINGTVRPDMSGPIRNMASAVLRAGIKDPDPDDTSSVTTYIPVIQIPPAADLVVEQSLLSNAPYHTGQRIDYRITVRNQGPDTATGILVSHLLSSGLGMPTAIVTDNGSATYEAGTSTIRWDAGALPAGDNSTLTFRVQLVEEGNAVSTTQARGAEDDPDTTSNQAVFTIPVTGDLFIPNTITPNGDGKNDQFMIPGLGRYPGSLLEIYNRLGNQVYHSNNYSNNWEGSGLPAGTYFYILKVNKPGGLKVYKGWIELLR